MKHNLFRMTQVNQTVWSTTLEDSAKKLYVLRMPFTGKIPIVGAHIRLGTLTDAGPPRFRLHCVSRSYALRGNRHFPPSNSLNSIVVLRGPEIPTWNQIVFKSNRWRNCNAGSNESCWSCPVETPAHNRAAVLDIRSILQIQVELGVPRGHCRTVEETRGRPGILALVAPTWSCLPGLFAMGALFWTGARFYHCQLGADGTRLESSLVSSVGLCSFYAEQDCSRCL